MEMGAKAVGILAVIHSKGECITHLEGKVMSAECLDGAIVERAIELFGARIAGREEEIKSEGKMITVYGLEHSNGALIHQVLKGQRKGVVGVMDTQAHAIRLSWEGKEIGVLHLEELLQFEGVVREEIPQYEEVPQSEITPEEQEQAEKIEAPQSEPSLSEQMAGEQDEI